MMFRLATKKLVRSVVLATVGTLAVLSPTVQKVEAITIHRNPIEVDETFPGTGGQSGREEIKAKIQPNSTTVGVGGGKLIDIFDAAADWWESAILDDFELTLNFGWGTPIPNDKGEFPSAQEIAFKFEDDSSLKRITNSSIVFNNNLNELFTWFLDKTPHLNEEYTKFSEVRKDLGGDLINVERRFFSPSSDIPVPNTIDLLTVAKHEIGHALGLDNKRESTNLKNIVIQEPLPFSGSQIPYLFIPSHFPSNEDLSDTIPIALNNALMANRGTLNERVLPSEVDILAVAQVSGFTQVNLDPHKVPEPTSILGLLTLGSFGAASALKRKQKQQKSAISATSNDQ